MRHPYSINLRERQVVYFVLAAIAFGLSILIARILLRLAWTPPTWVDIPGAFTIFGLLSVWFDKQLWRWPIVRRLGIATPILRGEWSGNINSSFLDHTTDQPVQLTVSQTWTTISLHLSAEYSESESIAAAINVGPQSTIVYCYRNRPKADATGTMHGHEGTVTLRIALAELVGDYYSGRDRTTQGTIALQRQRLP